MMKNFFNRGRHLLLAPQSSILSAATIIMFLNILSLTFGFIRHRVILNFFDQEMYGLYLAAFRLPDLTFELFALGAFSSAFIPVFTKTIKDNEKAAWDMAARVANIGALLFTCMAVLFGVFAYPLYSIIAPGFDIEQTTLVASLARILFSAQVLFVISYVLTGVLESQRRFLIPALSPLFYNLGIILGTIFLVPYLGLMAPAVGVVIGAFAHLIIQLPLAYRLGFRFKARLTLTPEVIKIGKLAGPRVVEMATLQILKTSELFFASLLSVASYTYLSLASTLQAAPISLFAVSLAKASLPTLSRQEDDKEFKKTFLMTLYQMMFFVIPISMVLIVFRIPIVRLFFGTKLFDWEATIQTGLVLTFFAIGIPFQAALTLLSRAFYARHDTWTPVRFAILDVIMTLILEAIFILGFHLPVWSLALANTLAAIIQMSILYVLLSHKINGKTLFSLLPIFKSVIASVVSGVVMFILLKFFDQSVWVKRLSFLEKIDEKTFLTFKNFVLDTRYTYNLIILTVAVGGIGAFLYFGISFLLRSSEFATLVNVVKSRRLGFPQKDSEPITQNASDS